MSQLEHTEAIEKRLWSAADNLRANSNYASNEYFLPVMGLVFLRHAYSRYLAVKVRIEPNQPSRGGKMRALTKEDFSQQSAIFLRPKAQLDHLVALRLAKMNLAVHYSCGGLRTEPGTWSLVFRAKGLYTWRAQVDTQVTQNPLQHVLGHIRLTAGIQNSRFVHRRLRRAADFFHHDATGTHVDGHQGLGGRPFRNRRSLPFRASGFVLVFLEKRKCHGVGVPGSMLRAGY